MLAKKLWTVTIVGLIAAVGIGYLLRPTGEKPTYSNASVVFKKTGDIVQTWVPTNDAASTLGLGGRTVLPEDYGMLWRFSPARKPIFVMTGMKLPLDFIWIKNGVVTEVTKQVQPTDSGQFVPKDTVTEVLEVNGGYTDRHGVVSGDVIFIQEAAWK